MGWRTIGLSRHRPVLHARRFAHQTITGLSYDDVGVLSDTSTNYYYSVKARCAHGYQSAASWQVGKFVLKVLPGYNHVSNPLVPSSANINDVIGTQLTGGPDVSLGDRVLVWNQAQQNYAAIAILIAGTGQPDYDGKWLDELSLPNLSTAQLGAGQAFWIQNRHGTQYVSLVGRVPMLPNSTLLSQAAQMQPLERRISCRLVWRIQISWRAGQAAAPMSRWAIAS